MVYDNDIHLLLAVPIYFMRKTGEDWQWRVSLQSLLAIWARNFLPGLLDAMLYELDMQDLQRNDCWTCLKVRWFSGVPASWKCLLDILQDTEKCDWQTTNIGKIVFVISYFLEKSVWYYGIGERPVVHFPAAWNPEIITQKLYYFNHSFSFLLDNSYILI